MSRTETETAAGPVPQQPSRFRSNGWAVLPLRVFLVGLFAFAGYAKLSYPGFFDPASANGLKASVSAARHGTPIGGALGPLADHPSVFGHITAYAELAIALGLLVGLLTRIAALGGIVLTALIVLSIDWGGIKEYTGSSGWFTSVDLAVAAALSVFVLGGPGPLSLDGWIARARARRHARDDAEPSFRDSELEDSRRRLQGDPDFDQHRTQQLAVPPRPEPEPNSLWNEGRRDATARDAAARDVPPRDVPPRDVPARDVPARDEPARDVPARDVPARDVPARDVPARDVPARDVPARDVPARDVPAAEVSDRQPATREVPTGEPGGQGPVRPDGGR